MSPEVQEPVDTHQVTAEMAEDSESLEDIELPMTIEGIELMGPGTWNGIEWTGEEIRRAFEQTEFETQRENEGEIEQNNALFFEHNDRDARAWIGEVKNFRMDDDSLVGDLVVVDEDAARKLAYGAKFGISAKVSGIRNQGVMRDFRFENFSLVVNPAVKTTFINNELEEEILQALEVHEPEFTSTDDREWNKPNLEDFDVDADDYDDLSEEEKNEVGNHFIVSKSGFPADNYVDLSLPVVEPDGTLNLNALQNAKARAGQVEGLTGDALERAVNIINRLANENFEDANFGTDNSKHGSGDEDEEEMSDCDHASDCAVHNEPAQEAGECSCELNDSSEEENNIMGENTPMTEDDVESDVEGSPDGEPEAEGSAESVDMESLKDELLNELKQELGDGEEVENDEEEEDGDVEESEEVDEPEDVEEEMSEFEEFLNENPDLSPTEAADAFEEAQKSPEEKAEEKIAEVKEEMASHIDDLKSQVEELSEQDADPARVSKASGQRYEELSEKVAEQDREQLRKGVMRKMLDQAGASHLYK